MWWKKYYQLNILARTIQKITMWNKIIIIKKKDESSLF